MTVEKKWLALGVLSLVAQMIFFIVLIWVAIWAYGLYIG